MPSFELKQTSSYRALKRWSFPLLRYSGILAQLFCYATVLSLLLLLFVSLGLVPLWFVGKLFLFCFILYLVFLEIDIFAKVKIRQPVASVVLENVDLDQSNLAELLDISSCEIIKNAMHMAKKKRLAQIPSELVFYAALSGSSDIQIAIARLGLDRSKILYDLKNIFTTYQQGTAYAATPNETLQQVLMEAVKFAIARQHAMVTELDLLAALACHDDFFKKLLISYDLKKDDVANITLWLDSVNGKIRARKQFWSQENLLRFGSIGRNWASGYTVTLDQFGIDWTKIASQHFFHEIIGHDKELASLESVLAKFDEGNALLVGEIGVGRKSIVEALARKCFEGKSLPELNYRRVVELDMVALNSRIQDTEKLESILDQIFEEARTAGDVILVIDGLENFVGLGEKKLGEIDITAMLAKYLALPHFKCIAITSFEAFHAKFTQQSALLEYFRKIEVAEVSEADTLKILQNTAIGLERRERVLIVYPTLRDIVRMASRYMPNSFFPKKALDLLNESVSRAKGLREKVVLPHHVAEVVTEKTDIPVGQMESKEKSVLLDMENLIHQRIVNQVEAVKEISIAMRRARAGISSKKRPMGTFLFLGPTGVGKTETAKALAEIYFKGEKNMIRLDMSEFQSIADIPRLLGAVSPVEQQGLLTVAVQEKPFSLVLLDEIEKAHPNILNLFLQVLDEGHITDGHGRKVLFTNTIIICTSNAGAADIFKAINAGEAVEKEKLLSGLFAKGMFRPEFVNRFDATVIFKPLSKEHLMQIAGIMLSNIGKSLAEKDIVFTFDDALKAKIVELSYKPEFGAREMRRVMQDNVENSIAEALLSDKITKGDTVSVDPETFTTIKK